MLVRTSSLSLENKGEHFVKGKVVLTKVWGPINYREFRIVEVQTTDDCPNAFARRRQEVGRDVKMKLKSIDFSLIAFFVLRYGPVLIRWSSRRPCLSLFANVKAWFKDGPEDETV